MRNPEILLSCRLAGVGRPSAADFLRLLGSCLPYLHIQISLLSGVFKVVGRKN